MTNLSIIVAGLVLLLGSFETPVQTKMICKTQKKPTELKVCVPKDKIDLQAGFVNVYLSQWAKSVSVTSKDSPIVIQQDWEFPISGYAPKFIKSPISFWLSSMFPNFKDSAHKDELNLEVQVRYSNGTITKVDGLVVRFKPSELVCKTMKEPVELKVCWPVRSTPGEAFVTITPSRLLQSIKVEYPEVDRLWVIEGDLGAGGLRLPQPRFDKSKPPLRYNLLRMFPSAKDQILEKNKADLTVEVRYDNGQRVKVDGISIQLR